MANDPRLFPVTYGSPHVQQADGRGDVSNGSRDAGGASACDTGLRCLCGALVARRVAGGIELKCRRCRRCLLLRIAADGHVTLEECAAETANG